MTAIAIMTMVLIVMAVIFFREKEGEVYEYKSQSDYKKRDNFNFGNVYIFYRN